GVVVGQVGRRRGRLHRPGGVEAGERHAVHVQRVFDALVVAGGGDLLGAHAVAEQEDHVPRLLVLQRRGHGAFGGIGVVGRECSSGGRRDSGDRRQREQDRTGDPKALAFHVPSFQLLDETEETASSTYEGASGADVELVFWCGEDFVTDCVGGVAAGSAGGAGRRWRAMSGGASAAGGEGTPAWEKRGGGVPPTPGVRGAP